MVLYMRDAVPLAQKNGCFQICAADDPMAIACEERAAYVSDLYGYLHEVFDPIRDRMRLLPSPPFNSCIYFSLSAETSTDITSLQRPASVGRPLDQVAKEDVSFVRVNDTTTFHHPDPLLKAERDGRESEGKKNCGRPSFLVLTLPPSVELLLAVTGDLKPTTPPPPPLLLLLHRRRCWRCLLPSSFSVPFFLSPNPQNPQSKLIPLEPITHLEIHPLLFGVRFASVGEIFQGKMRLPNLGSILTDSGDKRAYFCSFLLLGAVLGLAHLVGTPFFVSNKHVAKASKSLLAMAVGIKQKTVVDQIVEKFFSNNFTIMLFHYDDVVDEWRDLQWSDSALHVSKPCLISYYMEDGLPSFSYIQM
uniref:Uncharacterized protein LOC105032992 n=1 Tax=Elaeis guineensis var. tenera TaxID=51953 RepID=A0A8N4EYM5_ELAGV|nr:uncharacterized protein LOC105032992 [Elaeis guineensis]